jgi:hypothetical protein
VREHRLAAGILIGVGVVGFAVNAYTVPRYSARYEQSCNLCHYNPTGGGERVTYASQYIVPKEMAWKTLDEEGIGRIDPQVSKSITVGTDVRTFYFQHSSDNPTALRRPATDDFFQMQANLYVALQLTDRISAHLSRGLSTTNEVYGLGYLLPLDGWVKVGRFVPPFGWRLADHTAFTRDFMGFFPPGHTDVGVEAGISPGRFEATAAVMNGQLGFTQDLDQNLAFAGRAEYRFHLGPVGLSLGGSVWSNTEPQGDRLAAGPFGYLHWGRLTWVGEFDVSELDSVAGPSRTMWFTSHELEIQLRRGLDLRGTFDMVDPDQDFATGRQVRYGFGGEVMPYPFVRLEGMVYVYRNQEGDEGIALSDPEYTLLSAQVHFFY